MSRPSDEMDLISLRVTLSGQDATTAALAYDLVTYPRQRRQLYLYERPRDDTEGRLVDAGVTAAASQQPDGAFRSAVSLTMTDQQRLELLSPASYSTPGHRLRIQGDWTVHARRTVATLVHHGCRPTPTTHQLHGQSAPHRTEVARLFSDHQRRFPEISHGRGGQPPPDSLQPYGPILVEYWHRRDHGIELHIRRLTLAAPQAPLQLLDISTPAPTEDAPLILPTLAARVRRHGLDPDAFTGSRTRKLLDQLQT